MSNNTYTDPMNSYTYKIRNIGSSSSSSGGGGSGGVSGGGGGITEEDQATRMMMMSVSPTTTTTASTDLDYQEDEDQVLLTDLRRGPWTVEEDLILINYIANHGEGRWNSLARCAGLKRTGKSCRLRWLNYLRPDVRRGNITLEEQLLILELHSRWGNRWSKIAQYLPGRTDNEIKNYWRTRVQKHAKQLKCDVNSKQFKDTMRYLWMPRLVERIQAAAAAAAANPSGKGSEGGTATAGENNRTTYDQHLLLSAAVGGGSTTTAGSEYFMDVADVHIPIPTTATATPTPRRRHQLSTVHSNITPENSGGSTSTDHDSSFGTQGGVGVGISLADHLSSDFTVPALASAPPTTIGEGDRYYANSFHNYLQNHDYSINYDYNQEDYNSIAQDPRTNHNHHHMGGERGAFANFMDSLTSPSTSCGGNCLINHHHHQHQGSATTTTGFEEYYVPAAAAAAAAVTGTAPSMFHQNDSNGTTTTTTTTNYNQNNNISSTSYSTSEWYVGGRGSCGSGSDASDSFWNVDEDIFLLQQQFNVV